MISSTTYRMTPTRSRQQLQAHLGLKEAQEKLEASRVVIDDYVARSSEESKKLLDEVELKRNLAMMEARDFWEQRGKKMAEEFKESAENMQTMAEKTVADLQQAFGQWQDIFTRTPNNDSSDNKKD